MRSLRVAIRYLIIALALSLVLLPGVAIAQGSTYGDTGYVVQAGDTLANIAARFYVSVPAIISANGITDSDLLFEGEELVIPGAAWGGTSSSSDSTASGDTTNGSYDTYAEEYQGYLDPTRFVVSLSEQHCWLVQDYRVTGSWPCSTGRRGYDTPSGFFAVQSKFPVAYGAQWDFYMPYWVGIYWSGSTENGIHGLPFNEWGKDWADKIGTPISFGCIVLDDAAAEQVYDAAYIGMQVVILE